MMVMRLKEKEAKLMNEDIGSFFDVENSSQDDNGDDDNDVDDDDDDESVDVNNMSTDELLTLDTRNRRYGFRL